MNSQRIAIDTMFKTLISNQKRLEEKMDMILKLPDFASCAESMQNECCFILKKGKRKGEECKRKCGKYIFCTMHRDSTQNAESMQNKQIRLNEEFHGK